MTKQDVLRRFLFEESGVRGFWLRLNHSWQVALKHQHGPQEAQLLLGEALAAVVMLSASIKFQGSMILQAQGDGPISTLVAQATHDRKIRGLVKSETLPQTNSLQDIFGKGQLVITISPETGNPYQGIVPLIGQRLSDALETYFRQSEQLVTRLWLFSDQEHVTGLMLQQLPSADENTLDWERIEMLANTITAQELQELDCETILYRLFHQETLRLYDCEDVRFDCSCSAGKIENALRLLGRDELASVLVEQGKILVNCEFCNKQYQFDPIDVERILRWDITAPSNDTMRH